MDRKWHAEFDSRPVKEEEFKDETAGGIETEAVIEDDDGKIRVLTGKAKQVRRGHVSFKDNKFFFKSARTYRKLTQDEVASFKTETKEDERRVMKRQRVDIHKKRIRPMDKEKKDKRAKRVKMARRTKKRKAEEDFYLNHPRGTMMCSDFKRSFCRRGVKCKMMHSEVDREVGFFEARNRKMEKQSEDSVKQEINSFEANHEGWKNVAGWTKVVANFDTGAAITAVPRALEKAGLVSSDYETMSRSYKTASGELLEDQGGTTVKGYTEDGSGRSIDGRLVDVHRMLVSGGAVAKKNTVMLSGTNGWIIPKNGAIAKGLLDAFDKLVKQHPKEAKQMTELYEEKGIYVFDLWMNGTGVVGSSDSSTRSLGAVDEGFSRRALKP